MAVVNNTSFTTVGNATFGNGDYGLQFTANNTTKITTVTKNSATAATKARIVDLSFNVLGTATFSGDDATFSGSGVDITASTDYYVLINAEGSSFACDYGDVGSDLPSNNTDINFPLTNNAVFKTPYNATISSITTGGGNQVAIISVTTDAGVTFVPKATWFM